ncbi:outer membrane protein assembly factor BamB family protein [Rubripirellula amarantea]|nr:PQQ-binding-like beta-propeller repeat protein [Rubripirellula amarantea]
MTRFPVTFRCSIVILVATVSAVMVSKVDADDSSWTRFHGPEGLGYVAGESLPEAFPSGKPKWRVDLGSTDVGSPVVYGHSVYLLSTDSAAKTISLQSRDLATGQQNWITRHDQMPSRTHSRNTLGSCTPAVDDQHVYFAYASVEHTWLICVDHDGNEVWKRDFGSWVSSHGFGTSPRLITQADGTSAVVILLSQQAAEMDPGQTPGTSNLVAVSSTSGETIWNTKLTATRSCYGTPATFHDGQTQQLIGSNTGDGIFGIDSANGKMLWNKKVFDKRCCSTPIVFGDIAIATTGSGGGGNALVAVRIPKQEGESPQQIYRIDRNAPYVPTPVLKEGRLFMIDDKGIASCVSASDGEVFWKQRIGGNYSASPIVVGDTMITTSLDGTISLISASERFELLGQHSLDAPIAATPAYTQGNLLIRSGQELYCW